jgi:hypothetical protein
VTDLSPADWVVEGVDQTKFAVVSAQLPGGFEAYARVLHPALERRGSEYQSVSWAEVAEANERQMHRLVQFDALIGDDRDEQDDYTCATGEVPDAISGAFLEVLSRHTATPDTCWFGLWDGWGGIEGGSGAGTLGLAVEPGESVPEVHETPPAYPREIIDGPRVSLPGRDYILLRGPLAGIGEIHDELWPNVFWPDDRAWCVATDIDLDSTYVGGSERLIRELLDDASLEAWPAHLDDRVDVGADEINPPPRRRD